MTTSAEEIKALPTAHFVDWLERYARSLRYGDRPTNGNDIGFLEVARRLSEMEAENKRLREAQWEDNTVAAMYAALCGARHALDLLMGDTDPDEDTPAVLAMQAIQRAIELADARAALEHQQKGETP